jgi:pyruvate/2-oxoglutarate/acetoin dehydrogenase E1 component
VAERSLSMLEAVREALFQAMRRDEKVIVLGEDVVGGAGRGAPYEGTMGGTFGATKGLYEEFGASRVRDTPISEAGMTGIAVGAAAAGIKPVVDLMWSSFTLLAADQIVNQASKMSYMFGGQARVPLVVRMAIGAGLGAAGQHSDTYYSLFSHIPGLKVVTPASPIDAKGLLLAAIEDPNPVLVMEHMGLYNTRGHVPEDYYTIPLGKAKVVRTGDDVTLVAVGYMVRQAESAADELALDGISVEVIDPRTLSPLDTDSLVESARKTGRVIVIDESPPRCSIAADIAATVSEQAFDSLQGPVRRINAPHSPVPLSPSLEKAYIPSKERIVAEVRRSLAEQAQRR